MSVHDIPTPYLLFLGDAPDRGTAKTATGVAHWRPDICVGEFAYDDCKVTTGLPRLTIAAAAAAGAKTLVIGIANAGGFFAERWIASLVEALEAGLDIASGLHVRLRDIPAVRETAARLGRSLYDVRHFDAPIPVGTGRKRSGKRMLTVGTDCSIGKMFTALAVEREMRARGTAATFRATGQTGILIAGSGIAVDAVVADFISGATELLAPANPDPDHWDCVEGQGSLFHPSFAGVSLGLLHGAQADALIMCHEPTRTHMRGLRDQPLPDLAACIRANEGGAHLTNPRARVVGIAMNTAALDESAARRCLEETAQRYGLPCCDPVRTGVAALVDACLG